jgi:hypothetical protein
VLGLADAGRLLAGGGSPEGARWCQGRVRAPPGGLPRLRSWIRVALELPTWCLLLSACARSLGAQGARSSDKLVSSDIADEPHFCEPAVIPCLY